MGTPSENKALILRFVDALDRGDVAEAAACFDADRYYSHAFDADLAGTWQKMKQRYQNPAWSDVEVERVAVVAEGDRVALHTTFTGTHTGEFMGIPASGARVTIPSLQIWRVEGGQIVEHWGGFTLTEELFAQLR
jgi:steroid delta-isomerase-like uncharacterized protein